MIKRLAPRLSLALGALALAVGIPTQGGCDRQSSPSPEEIVSATGEALNMSACSCTTENAVAPYQNVLLCVVRGPWDPTTNTYPVISSTPLGDAGGCTSQCVPLLNAYVGDGGSQCTPFPNTPILDSGWDGNYNIWFNNCHAAANGACNLNPDTTAVLACMPTTTGQNPNQGHTVNISQFACGAVSPDDEDDASTLGSTDASSDPTCSQNCIWEPQAGTSARACCWQQTGGGAPDLNVQGAKCVQEKCGRQFTDAGAGVLNYAPMGPGDCATLNATAVACQACCSRNQWSTSYNNEGGTQANWLTQCNAACNPLLVTVTDSAPPLADSSVPLIPASTAACMQDVRQNSGGTPQAACAYCCNSGATTNTQSVKDCMAQNINCPQVTTWPVTDAGH